MSVVRRIMEKFRLNEISAVDTPAQAHARATIMKRADCVDAEYEKFCKRKFTAEERRGAAASGAAMKDGSYPIENKSDLENAIHAIGRGKGSHAAIRAHIVRRAKALGATDSLPEDWDNAKKLKKPLTDALAKAGLFTDPDGDEGARDFDEACEEQIFTAAFWDAYYKATSALQESLISIIKDDSIEDKQPLVTQSLQQFADYVEGILPADVSKSLAAGIAAFAGSAGTTLKGETMSDIRKALGLPATATDAEVTKAAEKMAADKKTLEDEKAKAEKSAAAIAKMSEKHKAFADNPKARLPSGGKEAFAAMEPGERDTHIEAHPLNDGDDDDAEKALKKGTAFKAQDGAVFHKRDFGTDAAYNFAKSQAETIAKQAADIAKAKEREDVASFEKRATDLGFEPTFGATLRKAYAGDAAAQGEVEKQMAALRKQADEGGLFTSFGKGSAKAGSAESELLAKAAEIKKAEPKLSEQQAYAKAYKDPSNADIRKRMKAEANA